MARASKPAGAWGREALSPFAASFSLFPSVEFGTVIAKLGDGVGENTGGRLQFAAQLARVGARSGATFRGRAG